VTTSDDYILIVEGDDDLRETLAELLYEEGYASCTASNGAEALEFLQVADPPSLVLADPPVPEPMGEDLVHALRTLPALASVPIFAMTTDRAASLGADAVIKKPIDVAALLRVVDGHCGRRVTWTSATPP
jgi:DNA-binding response OmpR family regulator